MRLAIKILFLVGIASVLYSFTFEPYTNKQEFEEKCSAIDWNNRGEKFRALRKEYLTAKYSLENYGLIFIVFAVYGYIFLRNGWDSFRIPKDKWTIALIGFGAVMLSLLGYVADFFLELHRGRYPPWSDSIVIPLGYTPSMFYMFSGWYLINLIGLINPFKTGGLVKNLRFRSINYWYVTMLIGTIGLVVELIIEEDFWWTTASILWCYYYLCLLIGRRDGAIDNEKNTLALQ